MTNPLPPVRVRYAPSPTGIPHIGNIRTALFCWLKNHRHPTVEIARLSQVFGRAKQHRGMPVMATGVHDTINF